MRFLVFALLSLPLLAVAQENDERLKKNVTFDDRYLTLAELGQRVTAEGGMPVVVERPISERKVAVFATDRPLSEVMVRIAETMFLEWVPEGEGYRLRLLPKVAAEEKSMFDAEARIEREGLLQEIRRCIAASRLPLAEYQEGYQRAKEELERSRGDQSEAGKRKTFDLTRELYRNYPAGDSREPWDRGKVLGQMNEGQLNALLSGEPFFASANPSANFLRLPEDSFQEMRKMAAGGSSNLLLTFAYRPGGKGIQWSYRTNGTPDGLSSGFTYSTQPLLMDSHDELENHPLVKRLEGWGKVGDPALLKVAYKGGVKPFESHPTGLWSQSDALRWLHRQTGVPVVGDAFRIAAIYENFGQKGTVDSWVKAITAHLYGHINPTPPYVRGDKGWLMLRNRTFWRKLQAEIPEGTLRPLEAKAKESPLTLEDYADLIAPLTVMQADNATQRETFLVDFPTYALHSSVDALRLWGSLPAGSKASALKNGLPLDNLRGSSLTAMRRYLFDVFLDYSPEKLMPYMLPAGRPWPQGMLLQVRPTTNDSLLSGPARVRFPTSDEQWGDDFATFTGWRFHITDRAQFSFTNIVLLSPKR